MPRIVKVIKYVIKKELSRRRLLIYVGVIRSNLRDFYSAYKKTFWRERYVDNTVSHSMEEAEKKLLKGLKKEYTCDKTIEITRRYKL